MGTKGKEAAELRARVAEENAAREKQLAEQREKDAREKAERDKALAIENERKRIEAQKQAEIEAEKKREANKKHVAGINNTILANMIELGVSDDMGKKIIGAIARGEIPHVRINY